MIMRHLTWKHSQTSNREEDNAQYKTSFESLYKASLSPYLKKKKKKKTENLHSFETQWQ